MDGQYWFCLIAGIIFAMPIVKKLVREPREKTWVRIAYTGVTLAVFVLAICYMVGSGYSPFLYFRF